MPTEYIGGIALIGDPGSGKSTIAYELDSQLGWQILSFASGIKNDVAKMLSGSEATSWAEELVAMALYGTKDSYRPLFQALGAFQRGRNPDYWLARLLKRMSPDEKYVIDDCRYFNEYEALRARGFKFIYLQRGPTTRALPAEQAAHESEQDWHRFKTDIVLTYEPGPKHQAERIIRRLKLNGDIEPELGDTVAEVSRGFAELADTMFNERPARELDAATKGLAGVCACGRKSWQEVAADHLVDQGPDDVMDESLFVPSAPAIVAGSVTVTFEEGLTMRSGQTLVIPHPYIEEAAVAWPI